MCDNALKGKYPLTVLDNIIAGKCHIIYVPAGMGGGQLG